MKTGFHLIPKCELVGGEERSHGFKHTQLIKHYFWNWGIKMEIKKGLFGEIDGKAVESYTLKNSNGMSITCINYGCIITELLVPDKQSQLENVVLGFDNLNDYIDHSPFFGAVIGRVAGRIKGAEFELDHKTYKLPANENQNHLHGGETGFDKVIWDVSTNKSNDKLSVLFTFRSEDGEEGYPGNLDVKVIYTLTNQNELTISYSATSDKKTLVNLTNHTYFNLSGNLQTDILNHKLTMDSDQFLELDDLFIPTGNFIDVEGTVFDFRNGRTISEGINSSDPQIKKAGNGYDHPFLLQRGKIDLVDETSGRKLVVETDQPAAILYTGNQLRGDFNVQGIPVRKHLGLCIETQGLPDSIHHSNFGSCILDKSEKFETKTTFKFEVVSEN